MEVSRRNEEVHKVWRYLGGRERFIKCLMI